MNQRGIENKQTNKQTNARLAFEFLTFIQNEA